MSVKKAIAYPERPRREGRSGASRPHVFRPSRFPSRFAAVFPAATHIAQEDFGRSHCFDVIHFADQR